MPDTSFFTDVLNLYFPEPHASLINGILFGERLKTTKEFYDSLKIVGLIHIVVLSGSNITLLSSIISAMTIKLGKKVSTLISIMMIVLFVIFVGAEPPIVRAGCMAVLASLAILYGRRNLVVYSMLLSALFIAVIWPDWIMSISFQLSYAATLGLILFARSTVIERKDDNPGIFSSLKAYAKDELKISLSAQIFTVPIIFFYFKQISFISPLSNIAISWAIAPLMIFGFLTAILGKLHFALGLLPSYVCYILLSYIVFITETLAQVPFAAIDLSK